MTSRFLRVATVALAAVLCLGGVSPPSGLADLDPDNRRAGSASRAAHRLRGATPGRRRGVYERRSPLADDACRVPVRQRTGGALQARPGRVRYDSSPCSRADGGRPRSIRARTPEEALAHFGRKVARIEQEAPQLPHHGALPRFRERAQLRQRHRPLRLLRSTTGAVSRCSRTSAASTPEPKRVEARFLRAVARRAYDENVFSVVLTPSSIHCTKITSTSISRATASTAPVDGRKRLA